MKETEKKKLMILGCGDAQTDLILESKRAGYTTIACDARPGTEGAKIADRYYQVDYMDLEKIRAIAKKERIDGIVSNSEPAMVHVACIAQEMNLIGNPVESVESLVSKTKFRELQKRAGVFAPEHVTADSCAELLEKVGALRFPIVMKPTLSAGTLGTTRLDRYDEKALTEAYRVCRSYSRSGQVSAERYVPMRSLWVSESDVFVIGDEILWDGMMWNKRSGETPMLPESYVFPMDLAEEKKAKIKDAIRKILKTAGIRHGEYNVEAYLTEKEEAFVIEINPRQGGNRIPRLIEEHCGVNLSRLLVSTAVGDMTYYDELKTFERKNRYVTMHAVYAREDGVLEDVYIDPAVRPFVRWIERRIRSGEKVAQGAAVFDGIANVALTFDSREEQRLYTDAIEKYIYPIVRKTI